jgi:hypothetical protein
VTRLLREHPEIGAELDPVGRLVAISWAGRREPVEVCTRWRVEDAWWGRPIARDYFKVVGTSWLALVYLDRVDGTWHLERLYD